MRIYDLPVNAEVADTLLMTVADWQDCVSLVHDFLCVDLSLRISGCMVPSVREHAVVKYKDFLL